MIREGGHSGIMSRENIERTERLRIDQGVYMKIHEREIKSVSFVSRERG